MFFSVIFYYVERTCLFCSVCTLYCLERFQECVWICGWVVRGRQFWVDNLQAWLLVFREILWAQYQLNQPQCNALTVASVLIIFPGPLSACILCFQLKRKSLEVCGIDLLVRRSSLIEVAHFHYPWYSRWRGARDMKVFFGLETQQNLTQSDFQLGRRCLEVSHPRGLSFFDVFSKCFLHSRIRRRSRLESSNRSDK